MKRWTSFRIPVAWGRSGTLALLLLFGIFIFSTSKQTTPPQPKNHLGNLGSCDGFEYASNIVVSVKTGATEATEKIPPQMRTTLRCIKNTIIFSDLEQDIGEYHLHDALDSVSSSVTTSNPDFKFYTQQQQLWKSKHDITSLKGVKNPQKPDDLAAWTLDKYKFIHVLEKAWAMKPDIYWYFVIDADTYVLWPNMLKWLSTLDPMKKSYFGSEVQISGVRFAHGGSGIILSRAAMYELVVVNNGTAGKWDSKTFEKCCGDLLLGEALKEYGIHLQDVWPLMSGETPFTMPFGPGTPEYWCRPALTMHHLTAVDMSELAKFEDGRKTKAERLTHAEIFKDFLYDLFPSERQNWDNLASDKGEFGKTGGVSLDIPNFEGCKAACEANENCFQCSHHGHTCFIGMSVRLGYAKPADQEGIWKSSWNRKRLETWLSKQVSCEHAIFLKQEDQK